MIVKYDANKINSVLQSFYNATGINIQLRKNDFSKIANNTRISTSYCREIQKCESGRKGCNTSDKTLMKKCSVSKKTEMHICHAGLADIAVPIMNEEEILGYIILGQMRVDNDFDTVADRLADIPVDYEIMKRCYMSLPVFDGDKIKSIVNIATILAEHILIGNMLSTQRLTFTERLEQYIEHNIDKDLSVKDICENVGISKSALYTKMHSFNGCTVSEYINKKRIIKACDMLVNTDFSIEMVSQKCGYSSSAYLSRIFKKITGVSPLKYRKTHSSS